MALPGRYVRGVEGTPRMAFFSSGGGDHPRRRRRSPSSAVERARRKQFGNQWGRFMHKVSQQLQERNSE